MAVVVHTMAGSLAGTDSWFRNPSAQVSAHFGTGDGGELHQYVKIEDTAWANGVLETGQRWNDLVKQAGRGELVGRNPNGFTVSIETEDRGDPNHAVTGGEYKATLSAARLALKRYPSIEYVTGHHVISPRSRANCPGRRWTMSGLIERLAADLGLKVFI